MALWQLGEKTEARANFDGASEWLKGYEQRCEESLKQGITQIPLPVQLKRLQAEAAALLGVTLPTVEPAPEPAAKVEEAKELPKSTPAPRQRKKRRNLDVRRRPSPILTRSSNSSRRTRVRGRARARLYVNLGQWEKAIADYDQALECQSDNETWQ